MLHEFGLDETAESVYRAMLAFPQDDLAQLSGRLGMPHEEVRGVLDRLHELALVRRLAEEPPRFRAVSPDVGMQVLVARQQARLALEQQRTEQARLAAAQLIADFAALAPDTGQGVTQLTGIEEIRDRINALCHQVQEEVLTFAPGGGQSAANMEAAKPQDRMLLERGVQMRTLYLDSVRNHPPTVAYARWLADLGAQVRTVPSLPVRMMIVDRRAAIIPVHGENTAHGAVELTGHGTLAALCALFESVWDGATPFGGAGARPRDDRGLDAQEAAMLRMLGQGHTDEAIAKRLGVSTRTARRIAADLMDALGARSRFQAGARAVARGWITGEE
ncbi:helix-turn-helix domain-containing protein [Kitasatospora sp. NPDC007106]|uniref:helix-turn-helix domain-containing protein n=1 Tax=Kitasatospora sp. NPDC007106 TaxID=3156914 RepID=UPI0033D2DCF4